VTGLPDVNTASLEDDIRWLIEKEFGIGKSKAPEAGLPTENTAKGRANHGLLIAECISRIQLTPNR
jgi:hypothetical protein